MSVTQPAPRPCDLIEIIEPEPECCSPHSLPPEGNVKQRNYRVLTDNLRAYTPTGDIHTSPAKGKLVSRYDIAASLSTPRARILELVRAEDPGRDALEAIVRPAPRRGLARPLDDDTRRFLQRALLSPSPLLSGGNTPEPPRNPPPTGTVRSLAEELRDAEAGVRYRVLTPLPPRPPSNTTAEERERLGRLALSVDAECEGGGLEAAGRRLDALLLESRQLHSELQEIHADLQAESLRACRCTAAARALGAESQALRYLDDIVALLKGDLAAAQRARSWPFALGQKDGARNYVI